MNLIVWINTIVIHSVVRDGICCSCYYLWNNKNGVRLTKSCGCCSCLLLAFVLMLIDRVPLKAEWGGVETKNCNGPTGVMKRRKKMMRKMPSEVRKGEGGKRGGGKKAKWEKSVITRR